MMRWGRNKTAGIPILLIGCLLMACEREIISPIPSYPVYVKLDLDQGDHDLIPLGATLSITNPRTGIERIGFGGVLVINGYSSNTAINLFAYDLACPVEARRAVRVVPDQNGKAHCSVCGAVYNLAYGTGTPDTISPYPLRAYRVDSQGGNRFIVSN